MSFRNERATGISDRPCLILCHALCTRWLRPDAGRHRHRLEQRSRLVARVLDAAHLDVLGDARSPLRLVRDVAQGGRLSDRDDRAHAAHPARLRGRGRERRRRANDGGGDGRRARSEQRRRVHRTRSRRAGHRRSRSPTATRKPDSASTARFTACPSRTASCSTWAAAACSSSISGRGDCERSWSLPLGALRLNDRFLTSDPPTSRRDAQPQGSRLRDAGRGGRQLAAGRRAPGRYGRHDAQPGQGRPAAARRVPDLALARLRRSIGGDWTTQRGAGRRARPATGRACPG